MKIKVLLLKDVAKLGGKGDIVEVSDAMFRNLLKPRGEAKIADKKTIKEWEKRKEKKMIEEKHLNEKILEAIKKIKEQGLELKVSASETGNLYEKVDVKHIKNAFLKTYGFKPSDNQIDFPLKKVSKVGNYTFNFIKDGKKITLTLRVLKK